MLTSVIYQDNKMSMVDDFRLDGLIASNRIKLFLRSDGWVRISDGAVIRRNTKAWKEGET